MPLVWVRPISHAICVGERSSVRPSGVAPCQVRPASRNLPPLVPVVRVPGAAKTLVQASMKGMTS